MLQSGRSALANLSRQPRTKSVLRQWRRSDTAFTYAAPEDSMLRRGLIEVIEYMSGRARLEKLYLEHRDIMRPENAWAVAVQALELTAICDASRLAAVPKQGPLVVVANHPFGFIDGLVLTYLISTIRQDFKLFINKVMCQVPAAEGFMLPIDFTSTRSAAVANARSRAEARSCLKAGGCVIIFPSGAVSTSPRLFAPAVDTEWHSFVGRLILQSRAAVLPVYFPGQNSRLFQLASHLSLTLRLSLLMRELTRRIGTAVELRLGGVIPFERLDSFDGPDKLIESLRRKTYELATDDWMPDEGSMGFPHYAGAASGSPHCAG